MSLSQRLKAVETGMGLDEGEYLTVEAARAYLDDILEPYRTVFRDPDARGHLRQDSHHSRRPDGQHEGMCMAMDELREGEFQYLCAAREPSLRERYGFSVNPNRITAEELLRRPVYDPSRKRTEVKGETNMETR